MDLSNAERELLRRLARPTGRPNWFTSARDRFDDKHQVSLEILTQLAEKGLVALRPEPHLTPAGIEELRRP